MAVAVVFLYNSEVGSFVIGYSLSGTNEKTDQSKVAGHIPADSNGKK